ncbi:MAG TPA: methylated-DNA--[protein]-cysteine S-methyltransferase [Alphaproteobacteria bacterium]|nr:methylated-DNA--[protein]-cysteine S-methyltransferase [Alphaproteobacteria bacterium]
MPSLAIESPLGPLTLVQEGDAIAALHFDGRGGRDGTPLLREAEAQLAAYFTRRSTGFALPLAPRGSPFQRALWRRLQAIPYGEVCTYGALAAELGSEPRAVGWGCGSNPLPIVIPCHRVVASNGLGGYSGGKGRPTKVKLLALERIDLFSPPP